MFKKLGSYHFHEIKQYIGVDLPAFSAIKPQALRTIQNLEIFPVTEYFSDHFELDEDSRYNNSDYDSIDFNRSYSIRDDL